MAPSQQSTRRAMSRVGLALAGTYLVGAGFAVAYPVYMLKFDRIHSEFSGVPIMFLGMPWSLLVIELAALVGPPSQGLVPLLALTLPGVLLNAWLLYILGRRASGGRGRESVGRP